MENGSEAVTNTCGVLCHIPLSHLTSTQLWWTVPCTIASVPHWTCAAGSLHSALSELQKDAHLKAGTQWKCSYRQAINKGQDEWIDASVSPSSGATILRHNPHGSWEDPHWDWASAANCSIQLICKHLLLSSFITLLFPLLHFCFLWSPPKSATGVQILIWNLLRVESKLRQDGAAALKR